jgi:hypothetical protein
MLTRHAWDRRNTLKVDPCFISLPKDNLVDSSSFLIATILDIEKLSTLSFRSQEEESLQERRLEE